MVATFKFFVDKHGNHLNDEYITDAGNLHYNPNTAQLRIGDGVTRGGIPLGGSSANFDTSLIYTKGEIDSKSLSLLGGASANSDTLFELENAISNTSTAIANLANTVNNLPPNKDAQLLNLNPVNNKTLSITNGNSVDLNVQSSSAQYLSLQFAYSTYQAQAGLIGKLSNSLPQNATVLAHSTSNPIYKSTGWGLAANKNSYLKLDSHKTYKIRFESTGFQAYNVTVNGANALSNYLLSSTYVTFFTEMGNTRWWLVTLPNNMKTVSPYASLGYRVGSHGGAYEFIYRHDKAFNYAYLGSPAYFYPTLLPSSDYKFDWGGTLNITSLD